MKFKYVILYVEDVSKTISFYEKAFDFTKKFVTPENDYGELDTGNTIISFASYDLASSNLDKGFQKPDINNLAFGIELAFTTENIELDFKKAINEGAILYEEIKEKPWGQKVGYLRDINGYLIEVCTPML